MIKVKKRIYLYRLVLMYSLIAILTDQNLVASEHMADFDCLIEPNAISEVGTGERGVIDEFLVDRGELIQKDQVLALLESRVEVLAVELARARAEVEARLESSRMNVEYLQRQLQRISDLVNREALPAQEKDKAETELALANYQLQEAMENQQIARVELMRATEALERRKIKSPMNGVVIERLLSTGEIVDDRPIIKVAEIEPLSVSVIMLVEYYNSVKIGMEAVVMPRIPEASARKATIVTVDAVVDAASNTFGVWMELPNEDRNIPGGIRCDVNILSD